MRSGGKEHAGRKWTVAERRRRRERGHGKQEERRKGSCSGRREGRTTPRDSVLRIDCLLA